MYGRMDYIDGTLESGKTFLYGDNIMGRTIGIGKQDFEKVRMNHNFYVDKTHFIKEWWEADDDVTLITRPRRFGKTLNMSMLEKFFSVRYAGRKDLFQGLAIWKDGKQVITRMLTKSITRL